MAEPGRAPSDSRNISAKANDIQILDGGMSRELIRLNAPFKQPEWSAQALLEAPHMVSQVHREFVEAGADILTTNSYALVPFHIGEDRFWTRGEELATLAGHLARTTADEEQSRSGRKILVAGSLPPVFGSYRPDLFQSDKVQSYLEILIRGLAPYVDVWLGETLSLIAEAEAVVSALGRQPKPVWISFNLNDGNEENKAARLRSGESVADAARKVLDLGVDSVLFNCNRPELMESAIHEARTVLKTQDRQIPIGVYANAFEPRPDEYAANENVAPTRSDLQGEVYARMARQWVRTGATIIGGCCGIGVEHIRVLARQLKEAQEKHE